MYVLRSSTMLHEGENIGPYRIVEQHGSGGMATIYKAYHPNLDRYVAIKMMHQAFLEDKTFRARFEREAQIVARLEHPNIVPVYDFSEHDGQPYLVMKYIEGETLKSVLAKQGALSLEDILRLMTPIAHALTYAHEHGVLHRDIKPSNIIIDGNGTPFLTDFGLARIAQAGESTMSQDMLLGTPHYISPEQAKGGIELDARTDVYSMGVILYELVVGRVPFSADTPYAIVHDHIYSPLPLPRKINPDIPEGVERVLLKALAKQPHDRYNTPREMMNEFSRALDTAGDVELSPDRAAAAAESIAKLRSEAMTDVESLPPVAPAPPAPPIPSPIVRVPPDPEQNPIGYARHQMREAIGDNSEKIERFVGRRTARRFSRMLDRIEASIEEKIADAQAEGKVQVNWGGKKKRITIPSKDDVSVISEDAIRRRVQERFNKRKEFMGHAAAYVAVNLLLWIIWAAGSNILGGITEFPWPMFATLGWGSGLAAHAIETYYKTGSRAEKRDRIVDEGMSEIYGDDWGLKVSEKEYKRASKTILRAHDKRLEFMQHASVYVIINLMLWGIWAASNNFLGGGIFSFPWPLIAMFGWGIGLVAHAVDTAAHSNKASRSQEAAVQRELERQRERFGYYDEKPKNEPDVIEGEGSVPLTEEGELTDSYAQEWDEDQKRKRR